LFPFSAPIFALIVSKVVFVVSGLLIVLPLTSQKSLAMVRAHLSSLFIAATTLVAGVILAIVVLHVLAN